MLHKFEEYDERNCVSRRYTIDIPEESWLLDHFVQLGQIFNRLQNNPRITDVFSPSKYERMPVALINGDVFAVGREAIRRYKHRNKQAHLQAKSPMPY
jgi:hypothetical protein